MIWTTGLFIVALTFNQGLAGVVKPKDFNEDATTKVLTANERISSGWEAYPGQFPYVTALRIVNPGGDVTRCGGSVVHRNWVLTSARCLFGRISVVVSAGVIDLTVEPEYISEDNKWWSHPSYDGNTATTIHPNDIGIVKLQRPLTYGKLVQPIRIQSSADALKDYSMEVLITCGWGWTRPNGEFSNVLYWANLFGVSNEFCHVAATISETHICATAWNVSTQSTCYGDNGGPLVYTGRDGERVLVGLTAFWNGADLHACGRPSNGFVRPGPFHGWLTNVTGLDFENLNEEEEVTEPPITEITEPDNEESDENSNSSESKEDPEISQLLNKLHVKVLKVSKVKVNNNIKIN